MRYTSCCCAQDVFSLYATNRVLACCVVSFFFSTYPIICVLYIFQRNVLLTAIKITLSRLKCTVSLFYTKRNTLLDDRERNMRKILEMSQRKWEHFHTFMALEKWGISFDWNLLSEWPVTLPHAIHPVRSSNKYHHQSLTFAHNLSKNQTFDTGWMGVRVEINKKRYFYGRALAGR